MNSPILQVKTASELGKRWGGKYYRIRCPRCREERWVASHDYMRLHFTGMCTKCSCVGNNAIGRKMRLLNREERIKKLLVCLKCGSKAFYEDEDGWGCLICGRIIYKDRVKLASLVKV